MSVVCVCVNRSKKHVSIAVRLDRGFESETGVFFSTVSFSTGCSQYIALLLSLLLSSTARREGAGEVCLWSPTRLSF